MPGYISDSPLARDLIRIGNEAIAIEDDAKLRDYFAEDYLFHGPGSNLSFEELSAYFASLRGGFSDLRLVREQIIVDGNFLAARTVFSGDFTGIFTYSPIGPRRAHWATPRTGSDRHIQVQRRWAPRRGMGADRLRSFLTKLGVTTTESAD
ncbi:MAG TPA: ester cyclase [Candidatus Dormibacteraeota bacterium]|nr:ester cyclase [Candidatus Dormibacteraeota bacterium]